MAFIFYDTETTGINVYFDQILQFAAILTDDNLVEVERFEIRSRLLPHTVASPGAMNVTNVTAAQLHQPGYPSHYEMICQIRDKLLDWEPAQFIGHNSLKFDEVLLRSAFYKNLFPPYLTNMNGNNRFDTYIALQAAHLYEPSAIVVPTGLNGKPSFKLDQIAPANGFNHANAHEAMSDVEATIHMTRLLRERAPETWSRGMRFCHKNSVADFCNDEEIFGLTEFYFGKPYTFLLHQIGRNPHDNNEIIAFDLSVDPDDLFGLSDIEMIDRITRAPKPIRRFRANGFPMLVDADDAHPYSKAQGIEFEVLEDRAQRLRLDSELTAKLISAFLQSKPDYEDSPHVEENLYSGFADNNDSALMEQFHEADWSERYNIVCRFNDPRYRELGEQLIYFESPEHLSPEIRRKWLGITNARLMGTGDPCPALTIPDAIQQADDLLANLDGQNQRLLLEHRALLVAQLEKLQNEGAQ